MPSLRDPKGIAPQRSSIAILVLDMISDFEFKDGVRVFRHALPIARRIRRLKERATRSSIPIIYVNDCDGRWRSDFPAYVRHCSGNGVRGAPIARLLAPEPEDYCVLKPKHSGFFLTPLESLLELMGVKRLVLTGVSSNQCVLFTANDAYVRDLELAIPRDCISARKPSDTRLALQYFVSVLGADTRPSTNLRFPRSS
jgi:nicotinamidase-related amidase